MSRNKTLLITAALLITAGISNGIMDTLQFHYTQTPLNPNNQFWNPDLSWKNKYAQDAAGTLLRPLRPKFFGSTTFLVGFTDAWHLFQLIMFACFRTAVVIALAQAYRLLPGWKNTVAWAGVWVLLHVVQAGGFHLIYTWLW